MTPESVALTREVMTSSRQRPTRGECYRNAFRFIPEAAEILGEPPMYVEGIVGIPGVREIAHGWLEAPDGRIVDVSLAWEDAGRLGPLNRHRPFGRFTVREVCDHLDRRGASLPILADKLEGAATEGGE